MEPIIQAFEKFMGEKGTRYDQFYIGIANDPIDRLANGHGVTESVPYIYWNAPLDTKIVRAIEKYFLDKGCKGGSGGGDDGTNYIYAYFVTITTKE